MTERPTVNAPGLTWRKRKHGWECRWRARTDLVKRGFIPKIVPLWVGTKDNQTPSAAALNWISDRANALQNEMLTWGRGGLPEEPREFVGTWASLADCYSTDPDSSYHKKRFASRQTDDTLCRRIKKDIGTLMVAETDGRQFKRMHAQWAAGGKVSMGHSMMTMVRTLAKFGSTMLNSKACREANLTLHDMKFDMGPPRSEQLTAEQANAIRALAPSIGRRSMAVAQAFQFETGMRQKDIIGEWIPVSEPGISDVHDRNLKWLMGIRWEEIDEQLVLRHVTSKRGHLKTAYLTLCPMVMEELRFMAKCAPEDPLLRSMLPASGPIIISEHNQAPWSNGEFRRIWRKLARACGIPDSVQNRDSRAGAAGEADLAGADVDDIRELLKHTESKMTRRYIRNSTDEKDARVMRLRIEHRKNKTAG